MKLDGAARRVRGPGRRLVHRRNSGRGGDNLRGLVCRWLVLPVVMVPPVCGPAIRLVTTASAILARLRVGDAAANTGATVPGSATQEQEHTAREQGQSHYAAHHAVCEEAGSEQCSPVRDFKGRGQDTPDCEPVRRPPCFCPEPPSGPRVARVNTGVIYRL